MALFLAASPRIAVAADPILIDSGEDTAVYRFLPAIARGSYPTLYAFTLQDAGQDHDFRTFLRFYPMPDLSGACVASAEVYVYYGFDFAGFGSGGTGPGVLTCSPVLAPWSAASATWNNQPPIGAPTGAVENITAYDFLACDVTATVQAWADGAPDYGIALSSPTDRVMGFYAFDAFGPGSQLDPNLKPALVITLADDPQACPEPAWAAPVAIAALLSWKRRHS